ncbi:MAG: hypothetical protein ABWZ88_01380 [Variovorax sp.]
MNKFCVAGALLVFTALPVAEARDHCMPSGRGCGPGNPAQAAADDAASLQPDALWAAPGGPHPRVAPIDSTPGGQSYGRWAAEWWKWVLSVPAAQNPLADNDPDGANCAVGQVDKVWFLAGSPRSGTVRTKCVVPAGRALFFPLVNNAYFAFPEDPADERTDFFARTKARCTEAAQFSEVSIDGVQVRNPARYFTGVQGSRSPIFKALLPADNVFTQPAGAEMNPSAEQGYYLFVWPLPAGRHVIHWIASGCTAGNMQDVTYHLTVTPR